MIISLIFDPATGRWEFAERDLLDRDFGEEWVDEMEEEIERLIALGVAGPGLVGRMGSARRVFCLVIDSLGVGALPDAASFGDTGTHTLGSPCGSVRRIGRTPFRCARFGRDRRGQESSAEVPPHRCLWSHG